LNNLAPASGTGDHIDPWGTQELLVSQAPEPIQAGVSEKLVIGRALICLMLAAFVFQRIYILFLASYIVAHTSLCIKIQLSIILTEMWT
jgi:hypothetical protein